jgi:hypothetical protein
MEIFLTDMELPIYVFWQAVKNDSTTYEYCFTEEGNNEAIIDKSNGVLLCDIFRCFEDEYSKGIESIFH